MGKKEKAEKVEKRRVLISKKLLTKRSNRTCSVCSTYDAGKYIIKLYGADF